MIIKPEAKKIWKHFLHEVIVDPKNKTSRYIALATTIAALAYPTYLQIRNDQEDISCSNTEVVGYLGSSMIIAVAGFTLADRKLKISPLESTGVTQ